ncbi:MAG: hypothetical protein MAG431_02383 [Chloroflexi bacterium]|nr:hypothetical protein [Chloroflexota bacterium]
MITVTLYARSGCGLCDQAEADLEALQAEFPHRLVILDIEEDEGLLRDYGTKIPVIEVGPYRVEAPFDRQKLAMTLGAARDRAAQLEAAGDEVYQKKVERGQKITTVDRFFRWFSNHYMWAFNTFMFLYVGLAFLAPIMQHAGLTVPARINYSVYSFLCHQRAYRTWFLYGKQIAYPREAAGVEGLATYEEVIGLDPGDDVAARKFKGDENAGYKVALCQRDVAIYVAMLLFGLIFSVFKTKIKPLPVFAWFVVAVVPIGLDGFSQLFGELSQQMSFIPWEFSRESTPFLRNLTGFLFGFASAWLMYPYVEEAMVDTRKVLAVKFSALGEGDE